MTTDPTTAVYGSYNARSVDPRVVAERFVAPPQFWDVVSESNTVLTGPRGSGKTTLLKMLAASALEQWQDPQAARARSEVTYSGVFVPADRSWSGQVDSLADQFEPELRGAVGLATFCIHALRSLSACAAMRVTPAEGAVSHDRVLMDREAQEQIVAAVWKLWGLTEPVGSFTGLRFALSDLLVELGKLARRARRSASAKTELEGHPALDLHPVESMIPFIERFNDAVGQEAHVWMFLIDEIEFLPPLIRSDLLKMMRGRDPRVMQKVSLAPYTAISERDDPLGGWVGHDYRRVDLTFGDKEDGYEFNRQLVEADLRERKINLTAEDLLGGSGRFESAPELADAYAAGGDNAAHIASLAEKDASFRRWLVAHHIDADNPGATTGVDRSATLRKAMPIIMLRDEYLHLVGDRLDRRSRKQPRTYLGSHSAYAICEGNPRLLKALVSRLASAADSGELNDATRVDVLTNASREYELHLRALTVPWALAPGLLPRRLVDKLGHYFEDRVLGEQFDPEPPLSFEIGSGDLQRPGLKDVLAQLIHYGALVPIDESRLRLTHMVAPLFHLPLRRGRAHAFRTIVGPATDHGKQLSIEDEESGHS